MPGIIQIVIAALVAGGLIHLFVIAYYQNFLAQLCGRLSGVYETRIHPGRTLWRKRTYSFIGNYINRSIKIHYTFNPAIFKSANQESGTELELNLQCIQKFWLRMLTETGKPDHEITIGNPPLDNHYAIHSNQPDAAIEFLRNAYVLEQLEKLRLIFSRLEFHQGSLKLTFSEPYLSQFKREDLEHVLHVMVRLADFYESQSASFRLNVVPAQETCPYCRSVLTSMTDSVFACAECGTRLHQGCWLQNGQCTTWGCSSNRAQPVRIPIPES